MSIQTADTISETLIQEKYREVRWCRREEIIRHDRHMKKQQYPNYVHSLSDCVKERVKCSVFGSFLDIFNVQQIQSQSLNENKHEVFEFDMASANAKDQIAIKHKNALFDNYTELLKNMTVSSETIKYDDLIKKLYQLRIANSYVNVVDIKLKDFAELQSLVLSGCNIFRMSGAAIPRKVKFLELYDNFISDVTGLVIDPPIDLLHLGLGRNELTDDSCLDLLSSSGKFGKLNSLDLSDNDICHLEAVLTHMQGLKSILSLQLEGNPCYVDSSYKSIISHQLPRLLYLDNVLLNELDRKIPSHRLMTSPTLVFHCYRIIALHPPPKDRSHSQTIHVEVDLPLLEKFSRPETKRSSKDSHSPIDSANKKIRPSDKQKDKGSKNEGRKHIKKAGPYDNPDESIRVNEQDNSYFKTVKVPWSKVLEFPPVHIKSPGENQTLIRDTFRSCATVKIVYLKLKNDDKNKITHGKSKNNSLHPGQDTVLKRVTLYSFKCNLESLNWSDESVDFYWSDHPQLGDTAIKVDGCLKNMLYTENKHKKLKKNSQEAKDVAVLPKIFTCQVGFGIKRDPEIISNKSRTAVNVR